MLKKNSYFYNSRMITFPRRSIMYNITTLFSIFSLPSLSFSLQIYLVLFFELKLSTLTDFF